MKPEEENVNDGPVVEGSLDENSKHKKKQRRRSIGFKRMVRVRTTLSKIDMTEEEKLNYWLRDDDYDQKRDRYNCDDQKNNSSSSRLWITTKSSLPRICILGWLLVVVLFTLGTTVFFLGNSEAMDSTALEQQQQHHSGHLRGEYLAERRLEESIENILPLTNHPIDELPATARVQTGITEFFDAAKGLVFDQ